MTTIDVGDVAPLRVVIRDDTGTVVDATSVTCTVTDPDGAAHNILLQHPAVGVYQGGFMVRLPGLHLVRWDAAGVHESSGTESFTGRDPDRVLPLSLDQVKFWLGMETHRFDDRLREIIDEVCAAGELYCGRVFGRRRVVVTVPAGSPRSVALPVGPVVSIVDDGGAVLAVDAEAATVTCRAGWPVDTTVTYVAGYRSQPASDVTGARGLLQHIWRQSRGAVKPGSPIDDFAPFGIPNFAADFWDLGRRTGFA